MNVTAENTEESDTRESSAKSAEWKSHASIVTRERMGHIELATPGFPYLVSARHAVYELAPLLGMPVADLEKVIYFAGYISHESLRARESKES